MFKKLRLCKARAAAIPLNSSRCLLAGMVLAVGLWSGGRCVAQNEKIAITETSKVAFILPATTIPAEETAAKELLHYLTRITGASGRIVRENQMAELNTALATETPIYVGDTRFAKEKLRDKRAFGDEEWVWQTQGKALILSGGKPRGTLYATYHFLESFGGVRWWNPWEEMVPRKAVLAIPALYRRSKPALVYRDIFTMFDQNGRLPQDAGRFMARSRLNRQGNVLVSAAYGGSRDYGPPEFAHTTHHYIPPEKYAKEHPDWFIGNGAATPTRGNSQLAFSNPAMRAEFLKNLLENIRTSTKEALEKQLPPPTVFNISQEDNRGGFVGPGDEALLADNGGAESAILLDFINYLADGIKAEFPDVYIDTLAYYSGEKAPTTLKARDNVIVRVTDTQSNVLLPITAERNAAMRHNVENWAKQCQHLRIWDYAITFYVPNMPSPTMPTYRQDLQYFLQHNVEGIFVELEEPLRADMHDMKAWIYSKLLEDPSLNYDELVRDFTDGYYGAAGPYVRQYLTQLEKAAKDSNADVDWDAGMLSFKFLTTAFMQQANATFDKAAAAVQDDAVLAQRVRNARYSLDNAIVRRYARLAQEWVREGKSPESFPLDRAATVARLRQRWTEQIELRIIPDDRAAALEKQNAELDRLVASPVFVPLPAKFADVPAEKLFVYNPHDTRNYSTVQVVEDKAAETGYATRFEVPDAEMEKYKLPMPWGIYNEVTKGTPLSGQIDTAQVPGPGYNWYQMGDVTLTGHEYFYFFWSWIIKNELHDTFDPADPSAKYEVWVDLKFTGPAFPHGKAEDKNAISVGRVVLVKK
jgi:hypothetical protein